MSADYSIIDPLPEIRPTATRCNELKDAVVTQSPLPQGIMVYTEPFRQGVPALNAYANATYGIDMNVNGAFSGTPVGIHNGGDSTLWTASVISGASNKFDFTSTTRAHTGSQSIDASNSVNGNEAQFESSTTIDSSSYHGVSGWVYITEWDDRDDKDIRLRFRLAGVDVGSTVNVREHIQVKLIGTWQKFSISLSEFGITSGNIDQLVLTTIDVGAGPPPDYFIDDIQLEEAGDPISFKLFSPHATKKFKITSTSLGIVSLNNSTLADASHQNMTWNQFFGIAALEVGVITAIEQNGVRTVNPPVHHFMDASNQPTAEITTGGNGTTTWWMSKVNQEFPIILDPTTGDFQEFIIADDLSNIQYFRVFAYGFLEDDIPA